MKVKTTCVTRAAPTFDPFSVSITLETQAEAQQFYSLFNMGRVVRAMPAIDANPIRGEMCKMFSPDSAAHQLFIARIEDGD